MIQILFLKVPYNYTYFDFPIEITLQTDRVIFESIFEQTKIYIFEPDLNWKLVKIREIRSIKDRWLVFQFISSILIRTQIYNTLLGNVV